MTPVPPYANHNLHVWPAGRAMDWHGHPYVQVIHVLAGALDVDWGEGWRSLGPGQVHVLPPGGRHRLRSASGHRQFGLNCTAARDERGIITALRAAFPRPCALPLAVEVVPVPQFASLAGEPEPLATLHWQALIDGYALALLGAAGGRGHGTMARRLLAHLEARVDGPILVEVVGSALGLGRAAVQHLCQKSFGCGVAHLHERLRLDHASRRLAEDGLSVTEVASAAGYGDIFQFSRAFRRLKGLSPRAWLRQQAERTG